jgi:phospholipase D
LKNKLTTRIVRAPTKIAKAYRRKPVILTALLVGGIVGHEVASYRYAAQAALTSSNAAIQVRFSPGGRCTQFVKEAIAKAQQTILVQAYTFTSLPIADALIQAHQRGVDVRILVDRSQLASKYTQVRYMAAQGIFVAVDVVPGIAHNKVMVIDDDYVLTGSFNWTKAAEASNAENLLLIKDTKTNAIYTKVWHRLDTLIDFLHIALRGLFRPLT